MDVRVYSAGGDDHAFAGDDFGARPDHDRDPGLHVGIACLADCGDTAALDRDVGLYDPPVIDDQGVGDYGIGGVFGDPLALAHAVPYDFSPAELHFLAVNGEVLLDLYPQVGIGKTQTVAHGRAEHFGVSLAPDFHLAPPCFFCPGAARSFPITLPWNPYTFRSPA